MNDFQKVAQRLAEGRVGAPHAGVYAPWAGVAGAQILFPPPKQVNGQGGVGQAAQQVQPGQVAQVPVFWTADAYRSAANSYMSLSKLTDMVIPAGLSRSFKIVPERQFQPLQLVFASRVTGVFVEQISIGNTNYFSHSDGYGMPCELYSEISQIMGLNWETINTSNGVNVKVFNSNAQNVNLLAGFAGIQLQA